MQGDMDKVFLTSVLCISISRTSLGSPLLTCNDVDPSSTSTVQCSCHNPGGLGIEWHIDGTYLTQCNQINGLCFTLVGYTFTVNSSTSTYTMDFGSYSYTDCSSVSCSDLTASSDSDLKTISVDESSLSQTISAISEPSGNHTNGNISFITDCLYKARSTNLNVTAKWTAVTEIREHVLQVDETISKIGSCQSCSYDFASKFSIEFYHEEEQSQNKEEARIRLELFIDGNPVSSLRKTTNNMYYVRVDGTNGGGGFKISIPCIVVPILIGLVVILIIILCCYNYKTPPEILEITPAETAIEIKWTDRVCCQCMSTYKIICESVVDGQKKDKKKQKIEKETKQTCYYFKSLEPFTEYEISLYARRFVCCPSSTVKKHVKTSLAQPKRLDASYEARETEIHLTWDKPISAGNSKLNYKVTWEQTSGITAKEKCEITTTKKTYTITNLIPGTMYNVKVYSIKDGEKSAWSNDIQTQMVIPTILTSILSPEKCDIRWNVPDLPGDANKLEYMIEYYLENEENLTNHCIILEEAQTSLKNLLPKKRYFIRVYVIYQSKVVETPGTSSFKTPNLGHSIDRSSVAAVRETTHNPVSDLPELIVIEKSSKKETSSTCYDIEWTVENFDESHSDGLRFLLECSWEKEGNRTKERKVLSKKEFKFERLFSDTIYNIRVYAIYQSNVLEPPGEYRFRTQPMKSQPLTPIVPSKKRTLEDLLPEMSINTGNIRTITAK